MQNKTTIIIGAGPAGLMAAQKLAEQGVQVKIFDQNKAAARKFLVAGKGGFNLTHSENVHTFIQKYDAPEIQKIVADFDNEKVVQWLADLGITTYQGSSGKVFPTKNFKPIQVLNAWLQHLEQLGVQIFYNHVFMGFNEGEVLLKHNGEVLSQPYAQLVLALGGGSWKKTGSDAEWIHQLSQKNIKINALESANSGYDTSENFHHLQGQYLKNIVLYYDGQQKAGEMVFTKYGIEGSPVYFMNRFTRKHRFPLVLHVDLKPQLAETELLNLLKGKEKISAILKRQIKISTTGLNLLKTLDKESYLDVENLANLIKRFPLEINGFRPIDEVISTAGGVAFSELNEKLELQKHPNVYCAGEMIDWEAPTGGYLLQACFSTGVWVAKNILE